MMAGIKGRNTKPELILRRGLHKRGFRYKLHDKSLPGKPDLVFPKYHAVLFANGCFWHGHKCNLFKWPKTREKFWRDKITGNIERDKRTDTALEAAGWRIARIWECSLKGKNKLPLDLIFDDCAEWLLGKKTELDVSGHE
jgi:DNA mismatch endonuclease (patch repair protein)